MSQHSVAIHVSSLLARYCSGLYCYLTLNSVVSNDVWHNLALVYDGSGATNTDKIKIYINGVDKSSSLTFVGTVPTALNASIGNLWLGNGHFVLQPAAACSRPFSPD